MFLLHFTLLAGENKSWREKSATSSLVSRLDATLLGQTVAADGW